MIRGLGRLPWRDKVLLPILFTIILASAAALPSIPRTIAIGPLRVPQEYPTIQAAINAASAGDTVLVSPGTYDESIIITKSLDLIGSSPATTTINATENGTGIEIANTTLVTVSNFHVRNINFDNAIEIQSSSQITIDQNLLEAPQSNGTYLINTNTSTIRNNTTTGNVYGLAIQGGFGNLVQADNSTGNTFAIGLYHTQGNKIKDSSLEKGTIGLQLLDSNGNVVSRTLVVNNALAGVRIVNSTANLFVENTVASNSGPGFLGGIELQNSATNRFYHNNIDNNTACCPSVDEQAFATNPSDISSNYWDNATGMPLALDPLLKFIDSNNDGVWSFNETVVYDTNNDGIYQPGKPLVASTPGPPPAAGTRLSSDPNLKFVNFTGNNHWTTPDPVVYDSNHDGIVQSSEPGVAGVGGNYWSDYKGLDNGNQGFASDGIGDTVLPHPCPTGGRPCSQSGPPGLDWHPLMRPWSSSVVNVTATPTPTGGYSQLQVSFTATANGGTPPYVFVWNFGDGTTARQQDPTHLYTDAGSYIATAFATDIDGMSASDQVPITVLASSGSLLVRVVDAGLHVVPGANVTSISQPPGQTTLSEVADTQGTVAWSNLHTGQYVVQVSVQGYVTTSQSVTVLRGETANLQIVLKRSPSPDYTLPALLIGGAGAAAIAGLSLFAWMRKKRREPQTKKLGVPRK